jgi:hypothetical protein
MVYVSSHVGNRIGRITRQEIQPMRRTGVAYDVGASEWRPFDTILNYAVYDDAFSLKYDPDKGKNFIPGSNVRYPKDYDRMVGRVTRHDPWVEREAYTDSPYTGSYERSFDPHWDARLHSNHGNINDNLKAKADTKCLNNLRGGSSLELGVDLIESRKTLNMVAKTTIQLVEAYAAARRGNLAGAASALGISRGRGGKSIANGWLEYQYGWKPLMGTIYDGSQLLMRGFRKPQLFFARGTAEEDYEQTVNEQGTEKHVSGTLRVKTGVYYRVASAKSDLLDSAGLLNPLSIAWELVPFSFVFDWFVPVGNVLSAVSATAGLQYEAGYRSESRISREAHKKTGIPHRDSNYWTLLKAGEFSCETMHSLRRGLGGFPRPQFYANANPFSTPHVLNALALIRSQLR